MQIQLFDLKKTKHLEKIFLSAIIMLLWKLFFPTEDNLVYLLIGESFVVATFYFSYLYFKDFLQNKRLNSLTLVLNAGILASVIFFIFIALEPILSLITNSIPIGFFSSVEKIILSFLLLILSAYIFTILRTLFFLKQKRSPRFYFNIMLVFIAITSFYSNVLVFAEGTDYIFNALLVVTIILIVINSIRIPWIAFLSKKEKLYLLGISVALAILFSVLSSYSTPHGANEFLATFSPTLKTFLGILMIYGAIFFGIVFFITLFHLPTADAFDRKALEVSSLMNMSKLITQVFDMKELADTVTDITTQVCNSDSAWLALKENGNLTLVSAKNIGYIEADRMIKNLNYMIDLNAIKNVSVFSNDESPDVMPEGYCYLAISPLKVHNQIKGYLMTGRKFDNVFDEDEQKAINSFADYSAIAIENSKLLAESLEKERLEKELELARDVQYKILPHQTPQVECIDISALFIPAFEVGGDYYDFFKIGENKIGFIIADVSGKGISAAFIMAEVKGIFGSLSKMIISPREVLIKANEILKESLDKRSFVTAVYGFIDVTEGTVHLSRGGHSPILLVRDGFVQQLKPGGIGLGLNYSSTFTGSIEEIQIKMKEDDILVFFTDGIPEAKNADDEEYGQERFERVILNNRNEDTGTISKHIIQEVTTFAQGYPQHDDITLVIFKWKKNKNLGEV